MIEIIGASILVALTLFLALIAIYTVGYVLAAGAAAGWDSYKPERDKDGDEI